MIAANELSKTVPLQHWYTALFAPLREALPVSGAVIMAPAGELHMLPLGLAYDVITGRYMAEEYCLGYVPSVSALAVAWRQAPRSSMKVAPDEPALLSVAYPGEPELLAVMDEAEAIMGLFPKVTQLHRQDATPDRVIQHAGDHDFIHIGGHANFDVYYYENTGMVLAKGGWLTVQRIITEMNLERTRLMTLGVCSGGEVVVQRGDEMVGLAHAIDDDGRGGGGWESVDRG